MAIKFKTIKIDTADFKYLVKYLAKEVKNDCALKEILESLIREAKGGVNLGCK